MTNQERAIDLAIALWDKLQDEPTFRFSDVDDFILAVKDIVRENDDANQLCADSLIFSQDLKLPLTFGGDLIYSIERIANTSTHLIIFTHEMGSEEIGAIVLDHWTSDA